MTHNTRGGIVIFVDYFNEDKQILEWIVERATDLGLGTSLRINKPIGRGTTGFHLNHNRDYWQLSLFSTHRILGFILKLVLRHQEKLARRELALSTSEVASYGQIQNQDKGRCVTICGDGREDLFENAFSAHEATGKIEVGVYGCVILIDWVGQLVSHAMQ